MEDAEIASRLAACVMRSLAKDEGKAQAPGEELSGYGAMLGERAFEMPCRHSRTPYCLVSLAPSFEAEGWVTVSVSGHGGRKASACSMKLRPSEGDAPLPETAEALRRIWLSAKQSGTFGLSRPGRTWTQESPGLTLWEAAGKYIATGDVDSVTVEEAGRAAGRSDRADGWTGDEGFRKAVRERGSEQCLRLTLTTGGIRDGMRELTVEI